MTLKKVLLALLLLPGFAFASLPVKTLIPIEHIYSPKGFDSNDNTQVVIAGNLPNLCHTAPMTKVYVDGKNVYVKVFAYRYDESNPFCPQVVVPFIEVVDLGILNKGNYNIIVNSLTEYEAKGSVFINESMSHAVDENIYANVEYIKKTEDSRIIKLVGHNPSDCFELDEVQIVDNKIDTYSILPKMKRIRDFCPLKMVPFELELEVPEKLKRDKVLLHVRSLQGKSVNSIFENKQSR